MKPLADAIFSAILQQAYLTGLQANDNVHQ